MLRSTAIGGILVALFSMVVVLNGSTARAQQPDNSQSKSLNIQTSAGDLHVGNDADARKAGLPLYPGARLRHDEDESKAANLSLFTEAFGIKLVMVKYDSDDAPGKVINFYREKLKKYGKVIECHTREHGGTHADFNDDDSKEDHSKEVKCEADNAGPVTELKVGTEGNQHVVAIEPRAPGSGSTFALVYVHTRGKQGDI
jgi:hypothetical protein